MVFRRRRPPLRRRPLGPGRRSIKRAAIRQLRVAHRLFDDGKWSQAAEHFERLASAAERRGMPQAAQLFLLSGRARIENGEQALGVKQLHNAIQLFGQFEQIQRLSQIRPRLTSELKQRGMDREAVELDKAIHDLLDRSHPFESAQYPPISSARLPVKCPSCGGALRPDEVEWLDPITAVCAYCGSLVQAGS